MDHCSYPKYFMESITSFVRHIIRLLWKGTTTLTVRLKDLSIVTYKFEYSNNDISNVNVVIEKYIPSIQLLPNKNSLLTIKDSGSISHLGVNITEVRLLDEVVLGFGKEALQKGCGKHAFVSSYTIHGYPILQIGNVGNGVYLSTIHSNSMR